jgi:hypothetical protein
MRMTNKRKRAQWFTLTTLAVVVFIAAICLGRWEAHTFLTKNFFVLLSGGAACSAIYCYLCGTNYW